MSLNSRMLCIVITLMFSRISFAGCGPGGYCGPQPGSGCHWEWPNVVCDGSTSSADHGTQMYDGIGTQGLSFQKTLYLGDLGPGGNYQMPMPTEAQKLELDAQAAKVCRESGSSSRRVSDYIVVYGHTNHYTVTASLAADYICDPNVI